MSGDEIKESMEIFKCYIHADTHNSCRQHYGRAKSHIELAENAFGRRHGPGNPLHIYAGHVENLYIAAELLVETELMLLGIPYKDTHGGIREYYRRSVESGKCPREFWSVFNKLDGLRQDARYLKAPFSISEADARELLDVVKKQATLLQERYSKELW